MSGGHGGGGGGRRRKKHEEEHENHERWMVTYADMLTLLLVLFIVLYAISSVNTSKFDALKASLTTAFNGGAASVVDGGNGVVQGETQNPSNSTPQVGPKGPTFTAKTNLKATAAAQNEANQFAKIQAAIKASLKKAGLAGAAQFTVNERGLVVTVLAGVTFGADSPTLEPEGAKILNAIMGSLNTVDNNISVDGHTNQVASQVDGWLLSSERAVTVAEYLIANGHVAPQRFTTSGHSEYEPLVDPTNPASVNLNRRVEITVLTKYSAADRTGLFTPSATATVTP